MYSKNIPQNAIYLALRRGGGWRHRATATIYRFRDNRVQIAFRQARIPTLFQFWVWNLETVVDIATKIRDPLTGIDLRRFAKFQPNRFSSFGGDAPQTDTHTHTHKHQTWYPHYDGEIKTKIDKCELITGTNLHIQHETQRNRTFQQYKIYHCHFCFCFSPIVVLFSEFKIRWFYKHDLYAVRYFVIAL